MTALLLTLALLTPARADDLSLRVGVGWVEESAAAGGVLSARRNPVALLDADWSRKRLQVGLDLRAAFGSRAITGVTGTARNCSRDWSARRGLSRQRSNAMSRR